MFDGYGYGYYGHMGGMPFFWWGFWILIFIAVLFWWRGPRGARREREPERETPRQILQRRLAQGEISVDDYEARKAVLDRDTS